jgi:hypothetical protein
MMQTENKSPVCILLKKKPRRNSVLSLQFESLYREPEILQEFLIFLKSVLKYNSMMFLSEVFNLQSAKESKLKIEKLKQIFEQFILQDAVYEFSISEKLKRSLVDVYETFQLESVENKITVNSMETLISEILERFLEPISTKMRVELLEDSWRLFLKTEVGENLIQKFKNDKTVCFPQVTQKFSYTDEYFSHPFIFDSDFDFSEYLLKESSNWEPCTNKKYKTNAFISKVGYLPNVCHSKFSETVKFECVLPVSMDRLILSYATNEGRLKSDSSISYIETLNYYNHEELKEIYQKNGWGEHIGRFQNELLINTTHLKMLPFLNQRILNNSVSMRLNPKDSSLIVITKPFIKDNMNFMESVVTDICPQFGKPMVKKKVYPVFGFCFHKYQNLDANSVKVSHILIMDMGGWTSNEKISKKVIEERSISFEEMMTKRIDLYTVDSKLQDYENEFSQDGKVLDGLGKMYSNILKEKGIQKIKFL